MQKEITIKINNDCYFYKGNMPCSFHKIDGRLCDNCGNYIKTEKRIIIVKLGAAGDVLRTTSILPALKNIYPNSHITWITQLDAGPLLNNNYINRVLFVERNYFEFIQNEHYDIAICLDVDQLGATILSLIKADKKQGFICNEKGCIVPVDDYAEEWWLMGLNDKLKRDNRKTYYEHIYKICNLPEPVNKPIINVNGGSKKNAENFYRKNNLMNYRKIIGINTGGGLRWQYKKWIKKNYAELINVLNEKYKDVGVLLFGGPDEKEYNEEIKEMIKVPIIDTGTDNIIEDFIALVNLTDIFFTPDSLGMHIAIALDKNVLVTVGPTSPWELDVFGKGEIIFSQMECISCYLSKCPKEINCMNSLDVNYVLEKISKYL